MADAPADREKHVDDARLRAYLQTQVVELERTGPLIAADEDPDAVHDFRVAARRLRSVLKSTKAQFDEEWLRSVRDELKWIAGTLGDARDLDVLLARLRRHSDVDAAPVARLLETEQRRAWRRGRAALASARYRALHDLLKEGLDSPTLGTPELALVERARREFTKLRRTMRKVGRDATVQEVHRARIQAKQARYAAELAEPFAGKRATSFVRAAKQFQDVVGAHQDAVVAAERIGRIVARTKRVETAFVAGRLVERAAAEQRRARDDLPRAWKRLDRKGRDAWSLP